MLANLPTLTLDTSRLPTTLPKEATIQIEMVEGVPIMKATDIVRERINWLIDKERESKLTMRERKELDSYEQLDDYLSFMNRVIRNLMLTQSPFVLAPNAN